MKKSYFSNSPGECPRCAWALPVSVAITLFAWLLNWTPLKTSVPMEQVSVTPENPGLLLSVALMLALFGLFFGVRTTLKKQLQKLQPVYPASDEVSVRRLSVVGLFRGLFHTGKVSMNVGSLTLLVGLMLASSVSTVHADNHGPKNGTPNAFTKGNPDVACTLTIDKVSVGECRNDAATGNVPKVLVAVFVSWTMAPAGQNIEITVDGVTKTINPSVNGCEPYQQFFVNADGSTLSADATFSGGGCSAPSVLFDVPPPCTGAAPCTGPTAIGGTVYNDFDSDGTKDASEFGVEGAQIDLFDDNENLLGTTTSDFRGKWTITGLTNGQKVRVEISNLPASYNPGGLGPDNDGGVVQFATVGNNCTVDFGILRVSDFCEDDPYVITPCYLRGDPLIGGTSGDLDVLVAVPYSATGNTSVNIYLAKNEEIGPTWGVAYQRETKKVFSSAFLKRHCGWGPDSLGGIYLTDASTLPLVSATPPSTYINLEQYGITCGKEFTLTRNLGANLNQPSYDGQVFDLVGKWGLGDMDISEDGDSLFVINLYSRTLVTMAIGNPAVFPVPASAVSEVTIPDPGCAANSDWRPFALKYKDGIFVYRWRLFCPIHTGCGRPDCVHLCLQSCIRHFYRSAEFPAGLFQGYCSYRIGALYQLESLDK
jgi:hypothetical protein